MLPPISDILQNEAQNQEFKLAPTPAQLGMAPLQRRQSMGMEFSTKISNNLLGISYLLPELFLISVSVYFQITKLLISCLQLFLE